MGIYLEKLEYHKLRSVPINLFLVERGIDSLKVSESMNEGCTPVLLGHVMGHDPVFFFFFLDQPRDRYDYRLSTSRARVVVRMYRYMYVPSRSDFLK